MSAAMSSQSLLPRMQVCIIFLILSIYLLGGGGCALKQTIHLIFWGYKIIFYYNITWSIPYMEEKIVVKVAFTASNDQAVHASCCGVVWQFCKQLDWIAYLTLPESAFLSSLVFLVFLFFLFFVFNQRHNSKTFFFVY